MSFPSLLTRALARVVVVAALAWGALVANGPTLRAEETEEIPCLSCRGTGACQAKGCKEGKTPCPATCLKLDAPGWIKKKIEGYPEDNIWMPFPWKVDGKSGTQYFSQHHAGELIEIENGKAVSRGQCPTCQGTSRVTCTTCQGDAKCKNCGGSGKIAAGGKKLTLIDAQGRELQAIVRARRGDTITVLRLPDQKVFDLPLSKLSAESNEVIEQKFPQDEKP